MTYIHTFIIYNYLVINVFVDHSKQCISTHIEINIQNKVEKLT